LKIAVCVKHAIDETELRVDSSGRPALQGAATKMSTFDKNAVEEGLRIKAKFSPGSEVTIFTVGPPDAKKTIKEALAMGADRGVHVVSEAAGRDSLLTAYLLSKSLQKTGPFDLVICAEGSSDTYDAQVSAMLGEWLSMPYVGYASKIEIDGGTAKILEAFEDSAQRVEVQLPFVVSVVSEINEPRYPTLIQIMQAGKKPMQEIPAAELLAAPGAPSARVNVLDTKVQSMNRKKILLEGSPADAAKKLLEALRGEGVISR
jgi:electron transfer flavoprotein beta subunit